MITRWRFPGLHTACALVALLFLSHCAFVEDLLHMRPLQVVSYQPSQRLVPAPEALAVAVHFSEPVHRVRTEHAFSLTDSRGPVAGRFSWNARGDRMEFHPHHGLQPGERYTAGLTTEAEDRRGNSLDRELSFTFLLRPHEDRPTVTTDVVFREGNGDLQEVALYFSQPMARATVISALSITPTFRYTLEWSDDDRTLRLLPIESLLPQTVYTITIATTAAGRDGNELAAPHETAISSADTGAPPVRSVVTTGSLLALSDEPHRTPVVVDHRDGFIVSFEYPVPLSHRLAVASLLPSAAILSHWNENHDTLTILPREPLPLDRRFELRVLERRYPFVVSGPRPPSLDGIAFSPNRHDTGPVPIEAAQMVTLIPGAPLVTRGEHAVLDLRIDHAADAEVTAASFLQSFRITSRNGTFSFTLTNVAFNPDDSPLLTSQPEAGDLEPGDPRRATVIRLSVAIARTGIEPVDIVTVELRAGFVDTRGNRRAAAETLLINAQ